MTKIKNLDYICRKQNCEGYSETFLRGICVKSESLSVTLNNVFSSRISSETEVHTQNMSYTKRPPRRMQPVVTVFK